MSSLVGRTLAHYRIEALLGEGGMGAVYRAEDTNLGRQVALKVLADDVEEVRFTSRLKDSPAVLVSAEGAASPALERVLREVHGDMPKTKRILELNPDHPLVVRLEALHEKEAAKERVEAYARLLYGQALLTEGSPIADPAEFSRRMNALLLNASGQALEGLTPSEEKASEEKASDASEAEVEVEADSEAEAAASEAEVEAKASEAEASET